MLDDRFEEFAAALSRVCVMRAMDGITLGSGMCTLEELHACGRREMWRERREAEILEQLGAWQAKIVSDWDARHAEWRRGGNAFREVEDKCWVLTCHFTLMDFVSSPFAKFDGCARLFSPLGPCAGLFRAIMQMDEGGAERRGQTMALVHQACPVTTPEMRRARQLLVESRRAWRLLFFVWMRFLLTQKGPPSPENCLVLSSAAEQFLRMQQRGFQKTLMAAKRRSGGSLPHN
ncbi:hypothetical protein TCSYLVIO_001076 [Trypanosoma cruzi]|nr:hypothetical protein TCSYLVIO_001076 [Trypanosoma cruzi]